MGKSLLDEVYYNPKSPAYLAGANAVYREAKKRRKTITLKNVTDYLCDQKTYTLHKPIRKRFTRNRVFAAGLDTDWQADLVEMGKYSKENQGFAYLLTCIDVLSKFAWVVPIKSKSSANVAAAFRKILKNDRKPWKLMTDSGKEFIGREFRDLMNEEDIHHFTSKSPDVKGSIVERYNRTLKTRLWKHFTLTNTHKYIDVLPLIVKSINSSVHRMIGMAPIDVTHKNYEEVHQRLYPEIDFKPKFKYKIGQLVRIAREKHKLKKGYMANFSDELFKVSKCLPRKPPVYRLKDLKGEDIVGVFYEAELTPALNDVYEIEKILKRRTKKGIKEVLVKWKGYSKTQWINESDLV